jgi:hypothetical protein
MLQAQPPLDPQCSCCLFSGPVSIFGDSLDVLLHGAAPIAST